MFHLAFYIPEEHAQKVKDALFTAGAGRVGNYSHCSFESKGLGQFKPLDGSDPFIGNKGEIEKVIELKVEMVCEEKLLANVIAVLKDVHPYETPVYCVTKTVNV